MPYKHMKMQRLQNIRRSFVLTTLLQRWIFLMPIAIISIYVTGHILMKQPQIQAEIYKRDIPDKDPQDTNYVSPHHQLIHKSMDLIGFHGSDEPFPPKSNNTKSSGVTVLAISSSQYVDLTKNWLQSIKTLHIYLNITIITTDLEAYNQLSSFSDLKLIEGSTLTSSRSWSNNRQSYTRFRWRHVLDLLRQNQDVLVSDVDMVWLENPFPYFSHQSQQDMFITWDPICKFCQSMTFFRSTENMIQFVKELVSRLSMSKDSSSNTNILNEMIETEFIPKLKYRVLDPLKFISGRYYFNKDWRTFHPKVSPVVVHANGINITSTNANDHRQHDAKVQNLKKYGLWYLHGKAKLSWEAGTVSIVGAK